MANNFFSKAVIRLPALPLSHFNDFVKDFEQSNEVFTRICNDKRFRNAVKFASNVLYKKLQDFLSGKLRDESDLDRFKLSIFKYYARMSTRATPFGLFSGVTTAEIRQGV
jgi:hypothetical protein